MNVQNKKVTNVLFVAVDNEAHRRPSVVMSNLTLQEIDIEGNENTDLGQSLNNETSFLHKRGFSWSKKEANHFCGILYKK